MTIKITDINAATGEVIEREATSEELAQMVVDKEMAKDAATQAASKAEAKAALLDRLGITAEEAQLLLG
jgi:hypothetical protein